MHLDVAIAAGLLATSIAIGLVSYRNRLERARLRASATHDPRPDPILRLTELQRETRQNMAEARTGLRDAASTIEKGVR